MRAIFLVSIFSVVLFGIFLLVPNPTFAITDPGNVGSTPPLCYPPFGMCIAADVCQQNGGKTATFATRGCTTTGCCISLPSCGSKGGTCTTAKFCNDNQGSSRTYTLGCSGTNSTCCVLPPSCTSQNGKCEASSKICRENGGSPISGTSGCGGSRPLCCKYPPKVIYHECFVNLDCKSGEYCSKRSTGNVCLPIPGGSSSGGVCPRECSPPAVGCVEGDRCFGTLLSGCDRVCLPSDGACRTQFSGNCGSINSCINSTIIQSVRCTNSSYVCCVPESVCSDRNGSRNRAGCACGGDGVTNVGCSSGLECYSGPESCRSTDSSGNCITSIGHGTTDYSPPSYSTIYLINNNSGYRQVFGYENQSAYYGTCTPPGGGARGSGGSVGTYYITGTVFVDTNINGKKDSGESVYRPPAGGEGATISLTGPSTNIVDLTNINGAYFFYNLRGGGVTYTVRLGIPDGYRYTTGATRSVRIARANVRSIDFGIAPSLTISGNVFEDVNDNGLKDGAEVNYKKGGITINSNSGKVNIDQANGSYIVTDLLSGTFLVSYASLPSGFLMSAPVNGPPPSFSVTVGSGCVIDLLVNGITGASCSGPNVVNLNFALKQYPSWVQTYGFDVRFDDGYTNIIPPAPAYPPYASVLDRQ